MAFAFRPGLLFSALLCILQVVITIVPGVYYAHKGLVSPDMRRSLSQISFNLLLPAMSFYNIAAQVSADTIGALWPFAANAVLSNLVGMLVGWAGSIAAGTPPHLRNHVIAACGFGNINSLPLLLVAAVCDERGMPFHAALGPRCASVGFGYVALGSAAMQTLMFPVAVWLLTKRPTAAAAAAAAAPLPEVSLTAALSWERAGGSDRSGGGGGGGGGDDGVDPEEHKLLQLRRGGVPAASSGSKLRTGAAEGMQPCLSFAKKYVLTPAVLVPAAAVLVGCSAPVKSLLFPVRTAPLGFTMGALNSIQASLLFVSSFILGTSLAKGPGPGGALVGRRTCVAVVVIRMLVLPALGALIVLGSHSLGIWRALDNVYAFLLLIQHAVPTANQMQNIASMHCNHESALGTLIFWQYAAAFAALPIWMTVYLYLLDRFRIIV